MDEDDAPEGRPALVLMPEYGVDVPVSNGQDSDGIGNLSVEESMALGVSAPMIERLRAWGESWDHDSFTGGPLKEFWPGSPLTVRWHSVSGRAAGIPNLPGYTQWPAVR